MSVWQQPWYTKAIPGRAGMPPHPKLLIFDSGKVQYARLKKARNILFQVFPSPKWSYLLTDKSVCLHFIQCVSGSRCCSCQRSVIFTKPGRELLHALIWHPILGQKKQSILLVICSLQEVNCFAHMQMLNYSCKLIPADVGAYRWVLHKLVKILY